MTEALLTTSVEIPKITDRTFNKIKTDLIESSVKEIFTSCTDDGLNIFIHPKTVLFALALIGEGDQRIRLMSIINKYKTDEVTLYSLDKKEQDNMCVNIAVMGFTTKPRISALTDRYVKIISMFHHPDDPDVNTYGESFKIMKMASYRVEDGRLLLPCILGDETLFCSVQHMPMDTVMSAVDRWVRDGRYHRLIKRTPTGDIIDFGGDLSNTQKFNTHITGAIKFFKETAAMWKVRPLRESELVSAVKDSASCEEYSLSELIIPDLTNIPKSDVQNIITKAADADFRRKSAMLMPDPLDIAIAAQEERIEKLTADDKEQRIKRAYSPYRKNIEYYLHLNVDDVFYYKEINGGR